MAAMMSQPGSEKACSTSMITATAANAPTARAGSMKRGSWPLVSARCSVAAAGAVVVTSAFPSCGGPWPQARSPR